MLGLQFSPRIRDLGHQRLYKLQNDPTIYTRLDARLTGRVNPTRLTHIHRCGRYHFDVETARSRRGLRPLRR